MKRRRELARAALLGPDGPRTRAAAGVPLRDDLTEDQLDNVAEHLKILGLRRIRPYDLRHTYTMLSIKAGIPIHAVSESLGHSDIALTLRTYARVLKSMKDEHVEKIQALFGPRRQLRQSPRR
jgi:integrase